MTELQKVLTSHFGDLSVEVVQSDGGEPCVTRRQLGEMLGYADPQNAIAVIHGRKKDRIDPLVGYVNLTTPGGTQEIVVYPFKAVLEVCRHSGQPL